MLSTVAFDFVLFFFVSREGEGEHGGRPLLIGRLIDNMYTVHICTILKGFSRLLWQCSGSTYTSIKKSFEARLYLNVS